MNAIQEERVKGYFITAAKDLIRGEGLVVVSTRNVAERAGYSYATLYNYFKDIRDLIFSCIEGFLEECKVFVESQSNGTSGGWEHLTAVSVNYARFFIQYPGIFDLFYQQKASVISTEKSNFQSLYTFFDTLSANDWEIIKSTMDQHQKRTFSTIEEHHKLALHGLLMMYLNNRIKIEYKEVIEKVQMLTMSGCF